jgi:hypothetical protein
LRRSEGEPRLFFAASRMPDTRRGVRSFRAPRGQSRLKPPGAAPFLQGREISCVAMFEIGAAAERADPTTTFRPAFPCRHRHSAEACPRRPESSLSARRAHRDFGSLDAEFLPHLLGDRVGSSRPICSAVQMHDCHCSAIPPRRLIHGPVLLIPTARETGERMAYVESETRPNRRVDKS